MLVLSRRVQEKIYLPTVNVVVQVLAVGPNMVRLGIEAPPEVRVLREELLHRPAPDVGLSEPLQGPG